jgi:hypothetical protein
MEKPMTDEAQEDIQEDIQEEVQNVDPGQITEASDETPEQKKRNGIQKRIDDMARQKYEAINERDLLKKENEEIQARLAALESVPKPEPTIESFDYDQDAFTQAVIDQRAEAAARKIFDEQQKRNIDAQEQAKVQEQIKVFSEREARFAQEIQDYDQIAKNPTLPINDAMADLIRTSDNGPAIAYHLGKNPQEAWRISQMQPMQAQRELLNIEFNIARPKQVSSAPDPVPDIGGMDIPDVDMDKLSIDEWVKRRRKQVYGK